MPARRSAAAAEPARPGLVVFTPLPPARTGIADYSADLLRALAPLYAITAVTDDHVVATPQPFAVVSARRYAARPEWQALPHVYMMGNNPDHLYMLRPMARRPGLVVLHDPGLHHLLDCATAALGDAAGYCRALAADYGAPGAVLAEQWRQTGLRDRAMVRGLPMLRQILGPAKHVLVHSHYAAWRVLAQVPHVPVSVAPHLAQAPAAPPDPAGLRARLGIPADAMVFLSLGFVSHIKRIDTALRALARIAGRLPTFRYVIAGELQPEEIDVPRLAAQLGLAAHVITTDFLAESDLGSAIAAADVVINLRHPVGGETSGTLIRALSAGACVVVVNDGPFAEIPEGAAVKLDWGPAIESDLADALLRLAISTDMRRGIGARAAAAMASGHAPANAVSAYQAAIAASARAAARPWRRQATLLYPTAQHKPPRGAPLWLAVGAMPRFADGGVLLARAPAADGEALAALGHRPLPLPWPGTPAVPPRGADAALLVLTARDGLDDAALLRRLNTVLGFDGVAVLEVRGLAPDARPLANRAEGATAWAGAGFTVEAVWVAPDVTGDAPSPPALVWRAVKRTEPWPPENLPADQEARPDAR